MLYALVNAEKAISHGFRREHHRLSKNGEMVINENELKNVDKDIHRAAKVLGGRVMEDYEVFNELI